MKLPIIDEKQGYNGVKSQPKKISYCKKTSGKSGAGQAGSPSKNNPGKHSY